MLEMGSNASVLQWHCAECSQINPTEQNTCLSCQALRLEENRQFEETKLKVVHAGPSSSSGVILTSSSDNSSDDENEDTGYEDERSEDR